MITQYNFLKTWLTSLTKTERGASLVEYALLVALIAVVVIGAVTLLGSTANETFSDVSSKIDTP
jgi:pilus assembly protein Flp/PilA